jgi:GNAT superfamily N-acetyltransferase
MTQWTGPGQYVVDDDTGRLNIPFIHQWLTTQSYWAKEREPMVTEQAIANSLNFGLYTPDGEPAGFCRWVTDRATFAWLCDVFVIDPHRGSGRGVFLVKTAMEHPEVAGLRLLLGTRDAHELYRRFGFSELVAPERYMELRGPSTSPQH